MNVSSCTLHERSGKVGGSRKRGGPRSAAYGVAPTDEDGARANGHTSAKARKAERRKRREGEKVCIHQLRIWLATLVLRTPAAATCIECT